MNIYVEEIDLNQGLLELFRIISAGDYQLVKQVDKAEKGLLLISRFFSAGEKSYVLSQLYQDGNLLGQVKENLVEVNVRIDNFKKKKDVATKRSILKLCKTSLPWGILTGIRPSKIVHKLLDGGLDQGEVKSILLDQYLIRRDKAELLLDICQDQRPYLRANKDKYSIYIGIPFCPSRCLYCSFPSMALSKDQDLIQSYIATLIYELKETRKLMGPNINTVYIGGGTPTALKARDLEYIIENVRSIFGQVVELTVEAGRPDTLDRDYLEMFLRNQVDRISINPQTMNDATLRLIGRNHTGQDIIDIYNLARELGIKNINMDLIVGLPGEGYQDVKKTLDQIKLMDPASLTIHNLALKTNSRFASLVNKYEIIDDDEAQSIFSLIETYTREMGLRPYYLYRQKHIVGNLENIGYSKLGPCIYNISMMEEEESIIGVGLGSVSKLVHSGRIKRIPNFKSMEDYISRIDELIDRKRQVLLKENL